jgi:rod shape-determining protein MreC
MIAKRGYFGTLHWIGPNSRLAYLEDLPRHARFKIGDDVVTSGYSAIFPSGVLVGKVLHVYNSPDGLSYRAQILLSTNFGKLRDVCVIDNAPMQEQLEVMRAAVDSIKVYSGKD